MSRTEDINTGVIFEPRDPFMVSAFDPWRYQTYTLKDPQDANGATLTGNCIFKKCIKNVFYNERQRLSNEPTCTEAPHWLYSTFMELELVSLAI